MVKVSAPLPPLTSATSLPSPPQEVAAVTAIPDHAITTCLAEHLVISDAAGQHVVAGPSEQQIIAALAKEGVVAVLAEQQIIARTAGECVIPGPAKEAGGWQRAVCLIQRDRIRAVLAEGLDQGGVCNAAVPPTIGTAPAPELSAAFGS